ncbi:hypothetical protein D9M73_43040 [compost metagenome]
MTPTLPPADAPARNLKEKVLLTAAVLMTLVTLAWLLRFSHYGIDFTDESFYLVWMAHPYRYAASATQYGFVYHPVYLLLDGQVAALRQFNILFTFALAWVLCWVFLKTTFAATLGKARLAVIAAALATVSQLFLAAWLPTPSYYSLTLQSLLIAAIGLLLCGAKPSAASIAGWLLVGVGGWLAFMAKPTTAGALAACALAYLLVAGKLKLRLLAVAAATSIALLCLSAWAIDGSIPVFIERLRAGVETAGILGGGHTLTQLLRIDSFQLGLKAKLLFLMVMSLAVGVAWLSQSKNPWLGKAGLLATLLLAALPLAMIFRVYPGYLRAGQFQDLLIWAVPLAAMVIAGVFLRSRPWLGLGRPQLAVALLFLLLPHAYAFGTNGNYWATGANAGLFWVLGGLATLAPMASSVNVGALLLPLALTGQLLTVALIQSGMANPYRQPEPLWKNDYAVKFGRPGQKLLLSGGFGPYVDQAVRTAAVAGFKKDTPMIDLTGQSPGILYALGANSIGQAWIIGGYPGSAALAEVSLKGVPCADLSQAWLLLEDDGPRRISPQVLSVYGANLATDFEMVGSFKTAAGAGGYEEARLQKVFKPIRAPEAAAAACSAKKPTSP